MSPRVAPTARRRPISGVRSRTEINMTARMPTPPTDERDARHAADQQRHRLGRLALGCQQRGLVLDREVVGLVAQPVPLAEKLPNLFLGLIKQFGALGLDVDRVDVIDVEQSAHRRSPAGRE